MNSWKKKPVRNIRKNTNRTNLSYRNKSLRSLNPSKTKKPKKIRKSLQYLLLLKKFKNRIDYKNVKLLKAFLNKYGKIRPRRKTRISVQKQHAIAHAIKKSRAFKLIPFTCDVKL